MLIRSENLVNGQVYRLPVLIYQSVLPQVLQGDIGQLELPLQFDPARTLFVPGIIHLQILEPELFTLHLYLLLQELSTSWYLAIITSAHHLKLALVPVRNGQQLACEDLQVLEGDRRALGRVHHAQVLVEARAHGEAEGEHDDRADHREDEDRDQRLLEEADRLRLLVLHRRGLDLAQLADQALVRRVVARQGGDRGQG